MGTTCMCATRSYVIYMLGRGYHGILCIATTNGGKLQATAATMSSNNKS